MSNERLREHVTSIGFNLTLSQNQIATLVLMHYHGGFNRFHTVTNHLRIGNYVTSAHGLTRRGLFRDRSPGACEICDVPFCDHHITKAGALVAELLKEAGLYQEVLDKYGFDIKEKSA